MQNEPNKTLRRLNKNNKLQIINNKLRGFYSEIHKKRELFVGFHNFWTQRYLTPCISNTYINFHPIIPFKRGIYQTFVRREKTQNKPNLKNRVSTCAQGRIVHRKYAKQTQFTCPMDVSAVTTRTKETIRLHKTRND